MAGPPRDRVFCGLAICFWLLAVSNFMKPLQVHGESGFVLLGTRLAGGDNLMWSLAFGAYLVVYGLGLWYMKRFALGLAHAYAIYVILNLAMYWRYHPPSGVGETVLAAVYTLIAMTGSAGAAVLLSMRREELG